MTKADLIERIHNSHGKGLTKKKVTELIDAVFYELGNHLVQQRITKNRAPKFTYPGFGTFTKKKRKARQGRNPATGETMKIPPTISIYFRPATDLKRRLNK